MAEKDRERIMREIAEEQERTRMSSAGELLAKMQSEGKLDFLDAMELPKQSKRYEKIYVSRKMAKSLAKVAPATKASKRR